MKGRQKKMTDGDLLDRVKRAEEIQLYTENRCSALEKENVVLKRFIKDLIYENRSTCFHFSNTTCQFNPDYINRAEELIGERLW